jgi:dephospho-CoA kinase
MNDPKGRDRPAVIGVLGAIAGGKSTVARWCEAQGARVLDADRFAQDALSEPEVRRELLARHGQSIAAKGSVAGELPQLDRRALARVVFRDTDHRRHLESVIHPRVRERMTAELAAALSSRDVPAVVLDIPLLLESSPFASACDQLLFVDTPDAKRVDRAARMRGWSAAELERRESAQWPPARKRAAADVVLDNSGDEADLERKLEEWLGRHGGFVGIPRRAAGPSSPE